MVRQINAKLVQIEQERGTEQGRGTFLGVVVCKYNSVSVCVEI